jgi:ribosomal protein S18 acetylase RimI-like enzyme
VEYLDTVICDYPSKILFEKKISTIAISGPFLGKANLCKPVLCMLPDWFGNNEANQQYFVSIEQLPTFLAQDEEQVVGFLSIKQHYSKTAELYIMAVLPEYHRCGIGRGLLAVAETYLQNQGVMYLQVKTLSESNPDPNYANTRAFYFAMGFSPLEEFKSLWNDANPALLLVKTLQRYISAI